MKFLYLLILVFCSFLISTCKLKEMNNIDNEKHYLKCDSLDFKLNFEGTEGFLDSIGFENAIYRILTNQDRIAIYRNPYQFYPNYPNYKYYFPDNIKNQMLHKLNLLNKTK